MEDPKIEAECLSEMQELFAEYQVQKIELIDLVANLRGLFDATGIYRDPIRSSFERAWSGLSYELELRTESWAPAGSSTDASLGAALASFQRWLSEMRDL